MSNHQNKACTADFVGPLLKRLKLAKEQVPENSEMEKFIDQISTEIEMTKKNLDSREILDRDLVGYFGKIERQIDPWIDENFREKKTDLPPKGTIIEVGNSSKGSYQMNGDSKVQDFMNSLDPLLSTYLKSLIIFPENTELKKRLVIYWWTVLFWGDIEYHEKLFLDLVEKNILIAVGRKHNNVIDRFTMEPIVHKLLMSNSENKYLNSRLYSTRQVLLNLNLRYLNSKDIMEINSKNELEVLQLGSWRYPEIEVQMGVEENSSKEMKSEDHIEVDQTDFLEKLGKNVKFLSLRGISGITELPESIGKLEFLKILDLRACHNLEKLPNKPESTLIQALKRWSLNKANMWFENLTILDTSECYLLDNMPKWICELYNLKVLKGFVVSSLGNKSHSCQLGDLRKLTKLRKLTIRIIMNMLDTDIFQGFNHLDNLLVLTITWGETKYEEIPTYYLPKKLEKLDIRSYPEADASKLKNPEELTNLKRLYIRGGKLTKIPHHDNWKVEILRLRFLKNLDSPTDLEELTKLFINLKYVEYVKYPRSKNLPKDGDNWHKCIFQEGESSNRGYQNNNNDYKIQKLVDSLDLLHPMAIKYLQSLIIFPENTKLKKRLVMYWWSGLFGEDTENNEKIFSNMVHEKVFIVVHREHNNVIDSITIEPKFHRLLNSKNESYGHLSFEERAKSSWSLSNDMLINLDKMYLASEDIMEISTKHDFKVVQLGNFLPKTENQLNDHIELDHTNFLKKIGKHVYYLSLGGILGISELHESIGKLEFLKILDLNGCHHLEILPPKPPMSTIWFNSLTVLNISECYLLEHMPKWICELKNLEVLKGFVVGSLGNKNQSCRLGDLAKLEKLRKLSITINIPMLVPNDFEGCSSLDQLLVLTITWRGEMYKQTPIYHLPRNLEKLDIRCDPATESLMLQNPEELTKLKRLYIRFGNFSSIPCHDNWNVEILRLRFLEKLVYPKDWNEVTRSFKNLRYVEYVGCPRPINFPNDGNSWRIEE